MNNAEEFLWVEKYRPKTVADTVLPTYLKDFFQKCVEQKNLPNMILAGRSGMGKTTIAKAALDEIGADYIIINASLHGNIDTLRTDIMRFASSVSVFSEGRKYVILDEADALNPVSTQPALRNFMETFSGNCGFIFTCNVKNKIIPALHSRCTVLDFDFKDEAPKLASAFMKRVIVVLENEKIEYNKAVVAQLVSMHFPDFRRTLNELQRHSIVGKIDTGVLTVLSDDSMTNLFDLLKVKEFAKIKEWVVDNLSYDQDHLMRRVYDHAWKMYKTESIPMAVLIIGKYQYQAAFARDPEITMMCCLTELMVECSFK
jgi:DNA polymerase III delta prime subunit